jgi:predicted dehydrogenase
MTAMPSHPEFLPTGRPVVGHRRDWGELPQEERLGIGVLGLHEGLTLLIGLRAARLCRAVAGCDLSPEKRAAAEEACPGLFVTEDYAEMLARDDVRIVAIYTPDPYHADHIEAAFRAGKDVLCTKPLINDPADAERVRRAAHETGRRLMVGQSTRFGEPFLRQRERFERRELGEVELVDAHYVHRMDWYYEKSPWTIEGTHWAYLGLSHPVDLVRWYLGRIAEVHAFGTVSSLGGSIGLKTPDAIVVNLRAENGRIGRVMGHYGMHELPKARSLIECLLMGSEGTSLARYPELRLTRLEDGIEIDEDMSHAMMGYYSRHELLGMHYGEFCNYAEYFASCLLSGTPNSPDLEEGLETVATMRAIVASLESGRAEPVVRL